MLKETVQIRIAADGLREYARAPELSLDPVLTLGAQRHGNRVALVEQRRQISYSALLDEVGRAAGGLSLLGVARGDRVALLMRNGIPYTCALWAIWRLGAIAVPLNHRLVASELMPLLDHVSPAVMVSEAALLDTAKKISRAGTTRLAGYESLFESGSPVVEPMVVDPLHPAALIFTSGTSGRPKAAKISHRNLLQTSLTCQEIVGRSSQDVELICVPQFNITGLAAQTIPILHAGGTAVLMERFEPAKALALIADHRVTATVAAPTMWWRMLAQDSRRHLDLSSLRLMLTGGAPLPTVLVQALVEAFPNATIGNGYGLTETCSMVTFISGSDLIAHPDSVGVPLPISDARVVDPASGSEAGADVPGELWVRGPQVFAGYWNAEDASQQALRGGWLATGDVAALGADGRLRLRDRVKDVIKRGGESVYSVEVEEALSGHPGVLEVAVVGVPDDELGERVTAALVAREGAFTHPEDATAEIRAFCQERLAHYKIPAHVLVVDELPRNASGKILKRDLRALISDGQVERAGQGPASARNERRP